MIALSALKLAATGANPGLALLRLFWKPLLIGALAMTALLTARAHWIGVGMNRCEAKHASAQARADKIQAKQEAKRDNVSATIATDTRQAAAKATGKTKEQTHERAQRIQAVAVTGRCVVPDGLPDLAPAIEAANAAHR